MSLSHLQWPQIVDEHVKRGEPFVLISLVHAIGSAPQVIGAKAIVTEKGLSDGTVGGGKVEAKAILFAQELLKNKNPQICHLVQWNLTKDVGMTCGGVVSFTFEIFNLKEWKVIVFGAGHVAQELVPLLCRLNTRVICIDDRAEWLDKIPAAFNLKKICHPEPKSLVQEMPRDAFFVSIQKGHAADLPVLSEILKIYDPPFVGVIGSASKATVLRANLKELGFSSEKIQSVRCPIGLPFGNNSPMEISISVLAQLLQERDRHFGLEKDW